MMTTIATRITDDIKTRQNIFVVVLSVLWCATEKSISLEASGTNSDGSSILTDTDIITNMNKICKRRSVFFRSPELAVTFLAFLS